MIDDPAVLTTAQLHRRGVTPSRIEHAVATGDLVRVRRGWYALRHADPSTLAAVRAGGRLSCISLLALHGAWARDDGRVHVRVARGRAVRRASEVRLHWTRDSLELEHAHDTPLDAIACAVECLDLRHAIASIDSCLHLGIVSEYELAARLRDSALGRRVLALCDPLAESGLESLTRLALHSARIRCRSQVVIPGIGRVDLLVGDRLVIELDGAAWHGGVADFERDRARDRALLARGYAVMRATYRQVMFQMPELVA